MVTDASLNHYKNWCRLHLQLICESQPETGLVQWLNIIGYYVISDEIRSKKMAGSTQLLRTEGSSFWHLKLWQASQQR